MGVAQDDHVILPVELYRVAQILIGIIFSVPPEPLVVLQKTVIEGPCKGYPREAF